MNESSSHTRPRVILLGASNLTRGISTVVETARLMLGGPLDVYAALGHGRSYGIDSRIFVRTLPGILQSGLWGVLDSPIPMEERQQLSTHTFALITDIGNDVMYGVDPAEITQWIRQCAQQLIAHNARLVITPPPIESVRALRPWKYHVVKTALFPTRRISFAQAIQRSNELHDRIVSMCDEMNIPTIALPGEWYGFDPIHIRRPVWPHAWHHILRPWLDDASESPSHAGASLRRWFHLRTRTPHDWRLLGLQRGRIQPSGRLADGTRISLF